MIGTDLELRHTVVEIEAVVAIPTETVYVPGGQCAEPRAVSTIFEVKNRPSFDPLIVHTSHLERIVPNVRNAGTCLQLARRFMPGRSPCCCPNRMSSRIS